MKVLFEVTNYKLIKNLKEEFETGNLYLVLGGNHQGKSSFCQLWKTLLEASNNVKSPVTFGEEDGKVVATIKNFKGIENNNFKVVFNFTNEKESFTLITPETKSIKNVTEIRKIFQYNHFTVDEFFSWGLTAEGRRKQAKILLQLLPEEVQNEISGIDALINEKNGSLFQKRAAANAEHDALVKAIAKGDLTGDEVNAIDREEYTRNAIKGYEETIASLEKQLSTNSEIILKARNIDNVIEMIGPLSISDESKLMIGKLLATEANELRKKIIPTEEVSKLKFEASEKLTKAKAYIEIIIAAKQKEKTREENKVNAQKVFDEKERLTVELEKYRRRKKDIFAESKLDPNLTIMDDELYYLEGDNPIPFTATSLSYSIAGLIVTDFIIRLNKTTPIILLGQANEYGKEALDKLALMAKTNNCAIFADKVQFGNEPLHIEVYERTK